MAGRNRNMIFIYIPVGTFPKTRKQLARDSGIPSLMNLNVPVFYADEDSRIVFTDLGKLNAYTHFNNKYPKFVEAGA